MFQGCFEEVSRHFKKAFTVIQGCFKEDWRVLQWSFKWVSVVFQKKFNEFCREVSKVFQGSFKAVLMCNFVVAWISSQLPKQKVGLFSSGGRLVSWSSYRAGEGR